MNKIDYLRTLVWLNQLMWITGCDTVRALAALVDPASVWIDAEGDEHQSKWYQYAHGAQVPASSLVDRVRSQYPKATFEIHHPVWRVLRGPSSARSWTRLRAAMADKWGDLPKLLRAYPTSQLKPSVAIGNALAERELGYLDALALFASARKSGWIQQGGDRDRGFSGVLSHLPLLYADDQLWDGMELPTLARALFLLEEALGLVPTPSEATNRALGIIIRRERVDVHRLHYPFALSKSIAMQRFLAARWSPDDRAHVRDFRRLPLRRRPK